MPPVYIVPESYRSDARLCVLQMPLRTRAQLYDCITVLEFRRLMRSLQRASLQVSP